MLHSMSGRSDEAVAIRRLSEDDVPALIVCTRRCYGESYPEPGFYEPSYIRSELHSRRLLSVGALVGRRVVGHLGMRIPIPGDAVAETIAGIVDPDYRGMGLMSRMGAQMGAAYRELGIVAMRHIATGAHDRTQRKIASSGGVATGVLLGHMPAGTDYRGIEHGFGDSRIAAVVYFQAFGRLGSLEVHLPGHCAEIVADLYKQLELDRRLVQRTHTRSAGPGGSTRAWAGSVHHDTRRGISSLRFGSLAGDATRPAIELVGEVLPQCQAVAYADVPIADRRAPQLLDLLQERGFCFGAILPGTAVSEAVRMQRISGAPISPWATVTASSGGRALLEWISRDCERTAG
jgi:Acetyltransferase (GNAT) family